MYATEVWQKRLRDALGSMHARRSRVLSSFKIELGGYVGSPLAPSDGLVQRWGEIEGGSSPNASTSAGIGARRTSAAATRPMAGAVWMP